MFPYLATIFGILFLPMAVTRAESVHQLLRAHRGQLNELLLDYQQTENDIALTRQVLDQDGSAPFRHSAARLCAPSVYASLLCSNRRTYLE